MGRLEDDGKRQHLVGKKRRLEESTFDGLPNDIVASIFDRLGWKDASNTCLVSRRYHHVLKTCVMYKKKLEFVEDREAVSCFEFVKSVNNILYKHEGLKVDSLRIAFDTPVLGRKEFEDGYLIWIQDCLNNWLTFGREKCVRSLDIDTFHSRSKCHLYVQHALQFPTFEGFGKLTSLSLMAVHVDDAALEQGLKSHLVNLESLFIGMTTHLKEVVINAPPKLKKLEIYRCYLLRSVDIVSAPNLECFRCQCTTKGSGILKFQDVPKLSNVCLGGLAISHNSLSELWKKARMLDKLQLQALSCLRVFTVHPQFDIMFDKLTSLSLQGIPICDADLKHLINLESLQIERSPLLQMVVVALPKLKMLEITNCFEIRSINIDSAPNLQSFKYHFKSILEHPDYYDKCDGCGQGVVHFKYVPKLSDLSFCRTGGLCLNYLNYLAEQLPEVGMLEKLELVMAPNCRNPGHAECMTYPKHFPQLTNLKELTCYIVLDEESPIRLLVFTDLLAACPKLRKLTVDYQGLRRDKRWGSDLIKAELRATSHVHYCLEEVEFWGCSGDLSYVETLNHLKEIAPNLEKLRLR